MMLGRVSRRRYLLASKCLVHSHARLAHMVTAKRRMGKLLMRVFVRAVFAVFCSTFSARRIARVFFGRKSRGTYFLPLHSFRASAFCFWLYTVRIRAMALRTILILASLEAAPPATLATRSCPNSVFISSSSFISSFDVLERSSYAFTRTMAAKSSSDGREWGARRGDRPAFLE